MLSCISPFIRNHFFFQQISTPLFIYPPHTDGQNAVVFYLGLDGMSPARFGNHALFPLSCTIATTASLGVSQSERVTLAYLPVLDLKKYEKIAGKKGKKVEMKRLVQEMELAVLHDALAHVIREFQNGGPITWNDRYSGKRMTANLFLGGLLGDLVELIKLALTAGVSSNMPCPECLINVRDLHGTDISNGDAPRRCSATYKEWREALLADSTNKIANDGFASQKCKSIKVMNVIFTSAIMGVTLLSVVPLLLFHYRLVNQSVITRC